MPSGLGHDRLGKAIVQDCDSQEMDRSLEEQSIKHFHSNPPDPAYSETRRPGCSKSETVCSSNPFRHSSLALSYTGQIEGKLLSLRRGKNGVSVA